MHSRIRRALTPSSRGPWILVSAIALALIVTPFAFAFGEGKPILGGKRSPSSDERKAYTSETQIIANVKSYGTRQSNKSATGGGAIYGCRSGAGGTEKGNAPCVRASNLANGRAFEFSGGNTTEVGRITSTNTNAAPFTTNATGVATGLNADQVDGKSADDIAPKFAAVSDAGTLGGNRGASSASNISAGRYEVKFASDISKCAYTVTEQGTSDNTGAASAEGVDANTVRVLTRAGGGADGTAPTPPANRAFHLVVTC